MKIYLKKFSVNGFQLEVLITTSLSDPDSAPHTSPGRPRICLTFAWVLDKENVSKSYQGIRSKITQPHNIVFIDINGIGHWIIAGKSPLLPSLSIW
ncbi:MAG: hypothetical protein WA326_13070, partial [Nitrososphaeraceae archaeon]